MAIQKPTQGEVYPDRKKLTALQAKRLGAMSEINPKELAGLTIAEISERFRFRIDPRWLFFQRVCGTVVKTDPVTGIEYPVPYATVEVEDTDCDLLGYFPPHYRWGWYFPFRCHREVIATALTDECGHFCVWIPRFDIDWVLRFRRERICFPIIFERPSLQDILQEVIGQHIPIPIPQPDPGPIGPRPGPGPDPSPLAGFDRGRFLQLVQDHAGPVAARSLDRLSSRASFGRNNSEMSGFLNAPAFPSELPPPLPSEFKIGSYASE